MCVREREREREMEEERMRERYRECVRNHAAKLGTYTTDGCCEYTSDELRTETLYCVACGCHRSFHRKGSTKYHVAIADAIADGSETTATAPHLRLQAGPGPEERWRERRRTRTRFTSEQKARMAAFAAAIGWKMPKKNKKKKKGEDDDDDDDDDADRLCRGAGVTRKSFKIWMHNHKSSGGDVNHHEEILKEM